MLIYACVLCLQVFDVISKESPINIAYTNAPIEPHMDLEYYESPPGLQFLFCLRYQCMQIYQTEECSNCEIPTVPYVLSCTSRE